MRVGNGVVCVSGVPVPVPGRFETDCAEKEKWITKTSWYGGREGERFLFVSLDRDTRSVYESGSCAHPYCTHGDCRAYRFVLQGASVPKRGSEEA